MGKSRCELTKMSKIWEKMGNPMPFEWVMGPNRHIMENYGDLQPSATHSPKYETHIVGPGDFFSWESPQTLPALFTGSFEHVEWFLKLNLLLKVQSTVLSSSEGTAAFHLAFK